jgi:ubiquinone/menaquinone biosynthesis C-methylase UbiE
MSTLYVLYLHLLMAAGAPRLFARLLRDPWYFGVLTGWTDSLAIEPGAHVLEMGCGPGGLSIHLAGRGAEAVGIDRSPGMVRLAERTARAQGSTARFHCTDAASLEAHTEGFDWIIAASLLNVVDQPLELLRAAVRITSPGGQGAFLVPAPAMTAQAANAYAERADLHPFARAILGTWQRRARTLGPDELAGLMSAAGYTRIRIDFPLNGMLVNALGQVSPSTPS